MKEWHVNLENQKRHHMEPHLQRQLILTLDIMGPEIAAKIAKLTKIPFKSIHGLLRELIRRGQVQKTTEGKYVLTDAGRKMAAIWMQTCGQQ